MSFRSKMAVALAMAMCLGSGSAFATKEASDCNYLPTEETLKILKQLFKGAGKYCDKAPDPELAAKLGEKLSSKLTKSCAKANAKIAGLDCATNGDPDATVPSPIDCSGVDTPAEVEATLIGEDTDCDGIVTPP